MCVNSPAFKHLKGIAIAHITEAIAHTTEAIATPLKYCPHHWSQQFP